MNETERRAAIRDFLLGERETEQGYWPHLHGASTTLAEANRFFAGAVLDFQIRAETAWKNGERLVDEIAPDPQRVWDWIASQSEAEWGELDAALRREKKQLHKFKWMHAKLRKIAIGLVQEYGSDPRNIWNGQTPAVVLDRLRALIRGEALPRMIIGALKDTETGIVAAGSDCKPDHHACRVIGRLIVGRPVDAKEGLSIARALYPSDPWALDAGLYWLGKSGVCAVSDPRCVECDAERLCAARNALAGV